LAAPITAIGGSVVLVALGSGPFLVLCCFCLFSFLRGSIRVSDREMHFYPTPVGRLSFFAAISCTGHDILHLFLLLFILTFRTEPLSLIDQCRGKKIICGRVVLGLYSGRVPFSALDWPDFNRRIRIVVAASMTFASKLQGCSNLS